MVFSIFCRYVNFETAWCCLPSKGLGNFVRRRRFSYESTTDYKESSYLTKL